MRRRPMIARRRSAFALLLFCAGALPRCSADDSLPRYASGAAEGTAGKGGGATGGGGSATAPTTLGTGDFSVTLDPAGGLAVTGPSGALLRLPNDAFQLGTVTKIDDLANYDPYPMLAKKPGAKEPDGLAWL